MMVINAISFPSPTNTASLLLLFLISYYSFFQKNFFLKTKDNNDDDTDFINPCPNPNCVRCQKYKQVQMSAKRRLPHLLYHWKINQENNSEVYSTEKDEQNGKSEFQRIVDGVANNDSRSLNSQRTSGQRPTVLFIPRLTHPVSSIVTHLHSKSCDAFLNEPSIRNVMLQEYLDSQMKDAQWTTNVIGTASSSVRNSVDQLWEVLYLMNQGQLIHENIDLYCPQTYSFISKNIVGLMQNCIFGNIFISVLYPGTIIEPHCGPTNIRHRLHYALSVPESAQDDNNGKGNSPILNVRNEVLKWEEGNTFVFDDSLVHSAEFPDNNNNCEVRVVLVVDLWHPSLSKDEMDLLQGLYPPI